MNTLAHDLLVRENGFTLSEEGTQVNRQLGYMVSLSQYETVVKLEDIKSFDFEPYKEIARTLNANIGGWLDNNKVYIDISIWIRDIHDAITFAKLNKQLAIYDIENGTTINTR